MSNELVQKEIKDIFSQCGDRICYLYERWQDEKEYENIEDYKKNLQELLVSHTIIRMTKRPFGFTTLIQGKLVHVFIKASRSSLTLKASLER